MKFRRINIFGGAGSGKSTMASHIYSSLKRLDHPVEFAHETVKMWTFDGRKPADYDQVYLIGQQMRIEDTILRCHPRSIVVCECPIHMSVVYAGRYCQHLKIAGSLSDLADRFDETYPALNFVLVRGSKVFHQQGRYGTKDEAMAVDDEIVSYLSSNRIDFTLIKWDAYDYAAEYAHRAIQFPAERGM